MSKIGTQSYTVDMLLRLKTAGALKVNTATLQVDGSDGIINIGEGRVEAVIFINATAVEIATGDEKYTITPVYSNDPTFASGIVTGPAISLGIATSPADVDLIEGQYEFPMTNVVNGVSYGYMKLALVVAGTLATGIDFAAFLGKRK